MLIVGTIYLRRSELKRVPQDILDFLSQNSTATVCFTDEAGSPYCFIGFYAFVSDHVLLAFKSSYGTNHERHSKNKSRVAGTIVKEESNLLKLKGIQFTGCSVDTDELEPEFVSAYYNKYPFAHFIPGYIWAIKIEYIKFTNNKAAFGNKTVWKISD